MPITYKYSHYTIVYQFDDYYAGLFGFYDVDTLYLPTLASCNVPVFGVYIWIMGVYIKSTFD